MNTSYFAFVKNKDISPSRLVSIAGRSPDGFSGRVYKKLAPHYNWWREWRDNNLSDDWYCQKYYETVLNKLDPKLVAAELGDNAVMLCYEKSGDFCHRHLVARWLEKSLGITITELTK